MQTRFILLDTAYIVNAHKTGNLGAVLASLNSPGIKVIIPHTIQSGDGNDRLIGGVGDDRLEGGYDSDTYVYNIGDGNDVIFDHRGTRDNVLQFGAGILFGDILVTRPVGDPSSLRISFKTVAGSIVIQNQTWGDAGIETFRFADGVERSEAQILAMLTAATPGDDNLQGTAGADTIWALEGADTVSGLGGADILHGQDGDDRLDGGEGPDTLSGGAGNDVYILDSVDDIVSEAPDQGTDTVETALAAYILPANVEMLVGTSAAGQVLTGNGLANSILGGSGGDTLDGGAGDDRMEGGTGNDIYFIDSPGDIVVEAANGGSDEIRTGLASFVLGPNFETLRVTNDIAHDLRGNSLDNFLHGGAGNDIFRLQDGGSDTAFGGEGVNSFYFGSAFSALDHVVGGTNRDALILQGDYSAGVTLGSNGQSNIVNMDSISLVPGNNTSFGDLSGSLYSYNLTVLNGAAAAGMTFKVNGLNLQVGENFAFNGAAETDAMFQIFGGRGVDSLTGGQLNDAFIFSFDGQFGPGDTVNGAGGYDVVYLRGDYVIDFNAPGYASPFTGVESIGLLSGTSTEFVSGGDGEFDYSIVWNDSILATGATMTINGSRLVANESLYFDGNQETGGTFRFFGGAGADTLIGGGGNDQITGGSGADLLRGNGGADVFRYSSSGDSVSGAMDLIQDFLPGSDKIDLQRVDAKSATPENDWFTFIGSEAFSATGSASAGQLRAFVVSGNLWQVEGDVNGDGIADLVFQLNVAAGQQLTQSDFMV